jgi:hypothetical protein
MDWAQLERCAARPAHPVFPVMQKRFQALHHHMIALKELQQNMAPVVPLLLPYLDRAVRLYGTLLQSFNVVRLLTEVRLCYSRALNCALNVMEDYREFGLPTAPVMSAVEALQLLIEHHDMLCSTFVVSVKV